MPEDRNPMGAPEKSLDERLEEVLFAKLGTDYRRDLQLTIRADSL